MAGTFGPMASDAFQRAADRARKVLKPGDRLTLGSSCGGSTQTVTFSHWSDGLGLPDPNSDTFSSRTLDDLSPWNITKVNGKAVTFRDPAGIAVVQADNARFEQERALLHAAQVQRRRRLMRIVGE
jgi:hypothetical protein